MDRFNHFKIYSSVTTISRAFFIFPKQTFVSVKHDLHIPPCPSSLGIHHLRSVSVNLTTVGILCKQNHTVFVFLYFTYFT